MFRDICADLEMVTQNGSIGAKCKCILASHSFHMALLYRVGRFLSGAPVVGVVVRVVIEYLIRVIYASDISLKSEIGPGLMFVHGHDIVIGGDVRIGKRCKIFNGVTLGNKDTETAISEQPILGNNIVIGTGAKLLGRIEIGDNVRIGANSVVISSFPSNVVVAGMPAKIVKRLDIGAT